MALSVFCELHNEIFALAEGCPECNAECTAALRNLPLVRRRYGTSATHPRRTRLGLIEAAQRDGACSVTSPQATSGLAMIEALLALQKAFHKHGLPVPTGLVFRTGGDVAVVEAEADRYCAIERQASDPEYDGHPIIVGLKIYSQPSVDG